MYLFNSFTYIIWVFLLIRALAFFSNSSSLRRRWRCDGPVMTVLGKRNERTRACLFYFKVNLMNTYRHRHEHVYCGCACVCSTATDAIRFRLVFISFAGMVTERICSCVACRLLPTYLLVQIKFIKTFIHLLQHVKSVETGKTFLCATYYVDRRNHEAMLCHSTRTKPTINHR